MTIADYCASLSRNDIVINKEYQRNDRVWPAQARSFLIETVCMGYPIPKFILNQKVDIQTKKVVKEIVDGQQRTKAIVDFFSNKLRLSRTLELSPLAGKIYDELDEENQANFLNYSLDVDLFVGASFPQVVEAFRRLNSFTFPLNSAEKRHAKYQRGIKWLIFYFCRQYEAYFRRAGVFSDKSIVRMRDTDLIGEIWDALERGVQTTKSKELDALYKRHDSESYDGAPFKTQLAEAFDTLQNWKDIDKTSMSSSYMTYALALALIHVKHGVETLEHLFVSPKLAKLDRSKCIRNLTTLATAFDTKDVEGAYGSFVTASLEKTNVQAQRAERFRWFCEALTREI